MTELLRLKYFYFIFFLFIILTTIASNKISADQQIRIIADEILADDLSGQIEAMGNAVAIDEKGSKINADKIIYKEKESIISAEGNIILNDSEGNTYFFDMLESDDQIINFESKNVKARLEDGSRIVGSSFKRKSTMV